VKWFIVYMSVLLTAIVTAVFIEVHRALQIYQIIERWYER